MACGRGPDFKFPLLTLIILLFSSHIVYSLYVSSSRDGQPLILEQGSSGFQHFSAENGLNLREKRDAQTSKLEIKHWISYLNDSHQQLMVHWVGVGSDVVICVARNTGVPGVSVPSAVYISYDYGDSFINRTEAFGMDDEGSAYASLDRFLAHPKFNNIVVFVDVANKVMFRTEDHGRNITRVDLDFHPSETTFIEDEPYAALLAFDKIDPARKLWLTRDLGRTWEVVQESVKSYALSPVSHAVSALPSVVPIKDYPTSDDNSTLLFVLRLEPSGKGTVLSSPNFFSGSRVLKVWMSNVDEFQIKGAFMFATQSDAQGRKELYISYKRGPFVRGVFYTELERRHYYVADVSEGQIFVVAGHTDTVANLFTSLAIDAEKVTFALSLERVFCYFPNSSWQDSWLSETTDEAFADVHKVEGLRGIYIASYVANTTDVSDIGPQHLQTVITFDRGGEWRPLSPPMFDDNGLPIKCNASLGCSLHLSQRFNQLYPSNRAVPILSSASAPGVILATGTVGRSLKGRPGVYLSRDGGLTWRQILKDYYFFNYGDHGGVLTAVKYYRSQGETRELLYSTDEGESFHSYVLPMGEDLRVYGLMTEPGFNTTVFTMFGSLQGHHQWLIVKVDLKSAFDRNCTDSDYKFWSPHAESGARVGCMLGLKETLQRRLASSNCYSGPDYQRNSRIEICECHAEDFECDAGFEPNLITHQCLRNKKLTSDPYAVPAVCPAGQMYNRTKGYRRIPGDSCFSGEESLFLPDQLPCPLEEKKEFLLVAQRDKIARLDLKENVMEVLPITMLKNVITVEFDMRNNCVYWADIVRDVIGRQCFNDGKSYPEILVENNLTSIEGMALDWVSNTLYFVDGVAAKISLIRTDMHKQGRMRRVILDKRVLTKPRGIAVHPKQGYLFWTDWEMTQPSVSRSNLDGSDVRRLFHNPVVEWPNGLTIDHIAERLYWVDARQDYIGSCDLNGTPKSFHKVLHDDDRVTHPFAVAVFKDTMYWDDWKKNSIFAADKDKGLDVHSILTNLQGLMDLKVFAHSVQEGTNLCGNSSTHNCSHICVGAPGGKFTCLCPQDMVEMGGTCFCPGKQPPLPNGTCPLVNASCEPGFFKCPERACIPQQWVCDKEPDCGDGADEKNCDRPTCKPNMHACPDGHCIPMTWLCDHDSDCADGSDEYNCTFVSCKSGQFRCGNGRCIPLPWRCDHEDDCMDMSDETGCNNTSGVNTCKPGEFACGAKCIPTTWRCDGDNDCAFGEDEKDCAKRSCPRWQFQCANKKCIVENWRCDGENDCDDGSDEVNCTAHGNPTTPKPKPTEEACYDWTFKCASGGRCIPYWWKCDGVNDCSDRSDEVGCDVTTTVATPPARPTPPSSNNVCKLHQFRCASGECIQQAWVCDGMKDCEGGEDEAACHEAGCAPNQFRCRVDGSCVFIKQVCDGHNQCPDGSDEEGCDHENNPSGPAGPSCAAGFFSCDASSCIPLAQRCNGHEDCYDGTDESDCAVQHRVYQVLDLNLDPHGIWPFNLIIFWSVPNTAADTVKLEFLPAIAEVKDHGEPQKWKNCSWTNETKYRYDELIPFTMYNMTVYVRNVAEPAVVFPPAKYLIAMTAEATPSPPINVTAVQKNDNTVEVGWVPPLEPNGVLKSYTVFTSPPIPPKAFYYPADVSKVSHEYAEIRNGFQSGVNYSFWVVARTEHHDSRFSEAVTVLFDSEKYQMTIRNFRAVHATETTISLEWDALPGAPEYRVRIRISPPYPHYRDIICTTNKVTLRGLAPGATYVMEVVRYPDDFSRESAITAHSTNGVKLAPVKGVKVNRRTGTSVHLTWSPYTSTNRSDDTPWVFGIYYATELSQLFHVFKIKATEMGMQATSADITGLEVCESYLFSVGVIEPLGLGPLSDPDAILTAFDVNAPPRRLTVGRDSQDEGRMVIYWEASCTEVTEPVGYDIIVTELNRNETTRMTLAKSRELVMKQMVRTHYGGDYLVTVSSTGPNARPAPSVHYQAPEIPSPIQVHAFPDRNGSCLLYWTTPPDLPKEIKGYRYQVLLSPGNSLNSTSVRIFDTENPSFTIDDLGEKGIYSFAVKLVTSDGYESGVSEVTSFYAPTSSLLHTSSRMSLVTVLVPCILALLLVSGGLAVCVIRHRRLQRSFANFANSHYDRRSGSTTFSGDGLEDEDSPVIRGFSDDEPLVIA